MKAMILVLVMVSFAGAEIRNLSWHKDKFNSSNGMFLKYDKVEHFIWMGTTTMVCEHYFPKKGWKYAIVIGLANEVKDSVMPWEKYGEIGGEGFSSKDMLANIGGVVAGHYLNKLIKKLF